MNKPLESNKLLFASNNKGKIKEIQAFASKLAIEILSPQDLGISIEVVEDGRTFIENATKKAQAYLPLVDESFYVIGDDSGIEIPALGGEPGVYTRRWAGYEMTDQEIVKYCLEKMRHLSGEDRKATFKTVLALGRGSDDFQYFEGQLDGVITEQPDVRPIQPGMPFRNIFLIPEVNKMLLDINDPGVNVISHRQKALKKIVDYLAEEF